MTKTLKELGFKSNRDQRRKPKVPGSEYHYRPTLEELAQSRRYLERHPSPGVPPDTGIGGSGHDDAIRKGDEGFET